MERCEIANGRKYPRIVRPNHAWCQDDWFAHVPDGNEADAPIFFGRSLVEKIRQCRVAQEIGSHSFSHVIFGDPGCSQDTAESEIAACVYLAREMGIELRSFAFPRNSIGYLEVLRAYGFRCYRGAGQRWYERRALPSAVTRLAHLWDVVTAAEPPVVLPERQASGLWNLPGSSIYFPMHGLRHLIPLSLRVKRARKGLDAAVRDKRIFHLWFHPTNLADRSDRMFAGLRQILEHAAWLREQCKLDILPMHALVPEQNGAENGKKGAVPTVVTGDQADR